MIKGVNKSVIEVADTGNRYFERAILFVKPEFVEESEKKLQSAAQSYVTQVGAPHSTRRAAYRKGHKKSNNRLQGAALCAVAVALVVAFIIYLCAF